MALKLTWNKAKGQEWADFWAVDLDHPHFNELAGVFVLWHTDPAPQTLYVGSGPVRDRLQALRADPKVLEHKYQQIYATWARVEKVQIPSIERFLLESLKPKLAIPPSSAPALEVNFPGQSLPGAAPDKPVPDDDLPGQQWEDLTAKGGLPDMKAAPKPPPVPPPAPKPPPGPPTTAKPPEAVAPQRKLTVLQKRFNELMAQKPQAKGLFGGGAATKAPAEDENLVVQIAQMIFEEAVRMRASDVHLEPLEDQLRVRFRVDGMLQEQLVIPRALNIRVVSRIRVMGNLDPEKDANVSRPQDARMAITVDGAGVDLRLSTFPTSFGDKAVLRLISRASKVPELAQLGLSPETVEGLRQVIHRPQGMIIITGPAGNGKSTTLYSILQSRADPSLNIVTLEDPIELQLRGITQSAVQPKIGFTFAEGLRAILRQDPNIVMVGEIRDKETAEIAMSAALTGHLLMSTLHTNSAMGAVTRMMDMGLEPYLIASALTAVGAQRLARRMCDKCREAVPMTPELHGQLDDILKRSGIAMKTDGIKSLQRGKGCDACGGTGYSGRILLFELFTMTPTLRQLVLRKAPLLELQLAAIQEGMRPMVADGIAKVAAGWTTLAEMLRVVAVVD